MLVHLLQRSSPLRGVPVWGRYLVTAALVLICFELRRLLDEIYPYPYLLFLPAVVLASFVFNRGSGFFATFLSAILAVYFFIEPRGSFLLHSAGTALSILLYLLVGMLIASVIEALRVTAEELAMANRELNERRADLRHSLNRLETVIESASDPIYLKDTDGRYTLANAAAVAMFGVPKSAVIGRRDRDFLPAEEAARIESVERSVTESGEPSATEEQRCIPGRGPRWHLVTKTPWYGPDGDLAGLIGIAREIHDLKQAGDELRAANEQKALLLKDLSHRMKNHLQSLIALMSTSRRHKPDADIDEVLQSTIGRIIVLARAYDRFEIKDGQRAVVNVSEYVQALVRDIGAAVIGSRQIEVTVDVARLEIDTSRAVTIGLIVNEAMTNALKHAFPHGRSGAIDVSLRDLDGSLELRIVDDGVGFPDGGVRSSTGQWLIRAMAQQLRGSVTWEGPRGTAVVARFPLRA